MFLDVNYDPTSIIMPSIGLKVGGNNPEWQFRVLKYIFNVELIITNRWGQIVFKQNYNQLNKSDVIFAWDGLNNQDKKIVEAGAYYFSLKGSTEDKNQVKQSGILYLLK